MRHQHITVHSVESRETFERLRRASVRTLFDCLQAFFYSIALNTRESYLLTLKLTCQFRRVSVKRSSAPLRQAAGSIIVSVGDMVMGMGWGLLRGGEARERVEGERSPGVCEGRE